MENLSLLDLVVLTRPMPTLNLRKGEMGTIVEILDTEHFLVEFADTKGITYAMTPVPTTSLMKVFYEPVLV